MQPKIAIAVTVVAAVAVVDGEQFLASVMLVIVIGTAGWHGDEAHSSQGRHCCAATVRIARGESIRGSALEHSFDGTPAETRQRRRPRERWRSRCSAHVAAWLSCLMVLDCTATGICIVFIILVVVIIVIFAVVIVVLEEEYVVLNVRLIVEADRTRSQQLVERHQ